ncbi:hypothetical protein KM043_007874 [Ampulex compressa]|nr:hypothetical protein KM043_007874 [Ampulex compressa]
MSKVSGWNTEIAPTRDRPAAASSGFKADSPNNSWRTKAGRRTKYKRDTYLALVSLCQEMMLRIEAGTRILEHPRVDCVNSWRGCWGYPISRGTLPGRRTRHGRRVPGAACQDPPGGADERRHGKDTGHSALERGKGRDDRGTRETTGGEGEAGARRDAQRRLEARETDYGTGMEKLRKLSRTATPETPLSAYRAKRATVDSAGYTVLRILDAQLPGGAPFCLSVPAAGRPHPLSLRPEASEAEGHRPQPPNDTTVLCY